MNQNNFYKYTRRLYIVPILLSGLIIGCSSDSTAPQIGNFSLSIKKADVTSHFASLDTLTLDTVKIMMKNVELFTDSSGREGEREDSAEVETGPFVINLNLNGSLNTIALTDIPEGAYRGVKFEIHRLWRNEVFTDSEFIDSTCGERGYSVMVRGSYMGNPFVYKSRQSFIQRVRFPNPVTVSNNGLINVTLTVDPYTWFMLNGNYINPNKERNHRLIDRLIRISFQNCLKDYDHNGDHGG
jgi:hypothetical protein